MKAKLLAIIAFLSLLVAACGVPTGTISSIKTPQLPTITTVNPSVLVKSYSFNLYFVTQNTFVPVLDIAQVKPDYLLALNLLTSQNPASSSLNNYLLGQALNVIPEAGFFEVSVGNWFFQLSHSEQFLAIGQLVLTLSGISSTNQFYIYNNNALIYLFSLNNTALLYPLTPKDFIPYLS